MNFNVKLRSLTPNCVLIWILFNLINLTSVKGDRGTSVGCYRQNQYLFNLNIFSGTIDICIDGCERLFYR